MSVAPSSPPGPYSYRLEHQFDRTPGLRNLPQQVCRVGGIAACAILRRFPGARRIGNQRAFRGIHGHESPVEGPCPAAAKRIIPTGIEDEEFHLHPGIVHAREEPIGCDGAVFHIARLTKRRPDGDQVVLAIDLGPVAREEKSPTLLRGTLVVKSSTARSMVDLSASRRSVTSKPKRRTMSAMSVASLMGLRRGAWG